MKLLTIIISLLVLSGCEVKDEEIDVPDTNEIVTEYEVIKLVRMNGREYSVEKLIPVEGLEFTLELTEYSFRGNSYTLEGHNRQYRVVVDDEEFYDLDIIRQDGFSFSNLLALGLPFVEVNEPSYILKRAFVLEDERYDVYEIFNSEYVSTSVPTYYDGLNHYELLAFSGQFKIVYKGTSYTDFRIVEEGILSIDDFSYSRIPVYVRE